MTAIEKKEMNNGKIANQENSGMVGVGVGLGAGVRTGTV